MIETGHEIAQAALVTLHDAIVEALSLADAIKFSAAGIHLDAARCEVINEIDRLFSGVKAPRDVDSGNAAAA